METRSTNRLVEYRAEIEGLYRDKWSGIRIAKLMLDKYGMKITPRSIQRQLHGWDMEVRGVGRADNGLDMFREISNEADAYWLGFLMGDSSVSENGNAIVLGIIDRGHLEKLKIQYGIPCEISVNEKSKEYKNWRDMYYIGIYSQRTVKNAARWGLVHDKNKRTVPDLEEGLMRHFWRGLWDADGHMGGVVASLTGKEIFMRGFRKWLGVEGKGTDGYCGGLYFAKNTTWRSTYSGAYAKLVAERLYRDCTVFLDRKKRRADPMIAGAFIFSKHGRRLDAELHGR